jgi:hypothetical protein
MRTSSKSGVLAVAALLCGAAVFGSACGGSGGDDRGAPAGGSGNASSAGSPGASGSGVANGGASTLPGAGAGGTATMACDSSTTCCATKVCTCPYPPGAAANTVIDDLEDGVVKGWKTATLANALGYWDFSNDASTGSSVVPATPTGLLAAAPGANGTGKSLHVSGAAHTGWGAALAAELANGCPFDASAYGGISFWAKGTSTVLEGTNKLLLLVGMPEFIPTENGGFCPDMATNPLCYARHRVLIDLASDWKQYTVTWADLAPPTYLTNGPAFNPNRIRDIVFNASGPSGDAKLTPAAFDFYVDELKFVAPGTPSTVGGGSGGASGTAGAANTAGAGGAAAGAGGASAGAGGAPAGAGGS